MKRRSPNCEVKTDSNNRVPLIGVDPVKDVVTMEYHNDAYDVWRDRGAKNRILIHIDGHIDFGFFADEDPGLLLNVRNKRELNSLLDKKYLWKFNDLKTDKLLNIGNYIYPAVKEGIVKSFYWVVPDPIWNSRSQRRLIRKTLKNITRLLPPSSRNIQDGEGYFKIDIYDCPLTVLPLDSLPEIHENVLLDIDTDYLMTYTIDGAAPYYDNKDLKPWAGPEELIKRLISKKIRSDLVTIAYSIEGGYTPLKYRYFGDDLAFLFKKPSALKNPPGEIKLRREVEDLLNKKCLDEAIIKMEEYLCLKPNDAVIHYRLFCVWQEKQEQMKSAQHYKKALGAEKAYNTSFNNFGLKYMRGGHFKKARQEYNKILDIDPKNIESLCGLAEISIQKKEWENAKKMCFLALELDPQDISIYNRLGDILAAAKDLKTAEKAYKEVLARSPGNAWAHYKLGDIYSRKGDVDGALNSYRMAGKFNLSFVGMHLKLASLYRKRGNWYKTRREYRKAFRLMWRQKFQYIRHWLTNISCMLLEK